MQAATDRAACVAAPQQHQPPPPATRRSPQGAAPRHGEEGQRRRRTAALRHTSDCRPRPGPVPADARPAAAAPHDTSPANNNGSEVRSPVVSNRPLHRAMQQRCCSCCIQICPALGILPPRQRLGFAIRSALPTSVRSTSTEPYHLRLAVIINDGALLDAPNEHRTVFARRANRPAPSTPADRPTEPWQDVYTDLSGKVRTASVTGAKYFAAFVDSYSGLLNSRAFFSFSHLANFFQVDPR